jgi:hypothetical protein
MGVPGTSVQYVQVLYITETVTLMPLHQIIDNFNLKIKDFVPVALCFGLGWQTS